MNLKKLIPASIRQKLKQLIGINENAFLLNELVNDIADRKISYLNHAETTKRFNDKVVVVNGATGSLGKDICMSFALEGANVIVCGRNESKVNDVVSWINAENLKAFPCVFDMTDDKSIQSGFETIIDTYKKIDVLINCAGGSSRKKRMPLVDQTVEQIDNMLSLNLRGPMLCCKFAGKYMMQQKSGSIINFHSLMGINGKAEYVDYGAAKSGITGLTNGLAIELGKYNINVNSVTPSYVPCSEVTANRVMQLKKSNYMNTVGCSSDISACVLFLASVEARFITGQNIIIDGGRVLGLVGD